MIDRILKVFFLASLSAVLFFVGWYLEAHNIYLGIAALFVLFATLLVFFKSKKIILLFLTIFFFSGLITRADLWNVNLWIKNSLTNLEEILSKGDTPITENPTHSEVSEGLIRNIQGFEFFSENMPKKLIVARPQIAYVIEDGALVNTFPVSGKVNDENYLFGTDIRTWLNKKQKLLKFDINGDTTPLWELDVEGRIMHHWGDIFEGKLYLPGREFVKFPNADTKKIGGMLGRCALRNAWSETIEILDYETGTTLDRIHILPLLAKLDPKPVYLTHTLRECVDPTHSNSIHVLNTPQQAQMFPDGKVGDMLLSMREIHSIVLIDKDTHEIKWNLFGKFNHQHSPQITEKGTLLVFDNLGSDPIYGQTRILEIDIATQEVVGIYESSDLEKPFHSKRGGFLQYIDGRIYVYEGAETMSKYLYMFELDCPGKYISDACVRKDIYRTRIPELMYGKVITP